MALIFEDDEIETHRSNYQHQQEQLEKLTDFLEYSRGKILVFHRPVESRESSLVIDKFVFIFTKKEIQ